MRHLGAILLCFAVGCGASNPMHGGGGASGGTGTDGCSDAAKLIYVIDSDGTFSSFKPDQMNINNSVFTDIGKLNCSAGLAQPFSMSVDRSATAWVEYYDSLTQSQLFKVSTTNAMCTSTSFVGGQQGMNEFGMGFVSDTSGGTTETLYIGGGGQVGKGTAWLGTLDTNTLMVTKGNTITGDPELTGTGLAELWGFFPVTNNNQMARVSKIDKMTAMESGTIPLSSLTGQAEAWAFAFYGGDFWVFLASGGGATIVYHVTQSGGMQPVDQLDTKTRHIVGAGVSTCAPTTPIG